MQSKNTKESFFTRLKQILYHPVVTYKPSQGVKNIIFLIFILTSTLFIYLLPLSPPTEEKVSAPAIIYFVIMIIIYLGYVFKPVWLGIFLIAISLPYYPIHLYNKFKELNETEREVSEEIILRLAPQYIEHQFYILIISYLIFEVMLRLLGKFSKKIRLKVKESPFMIRFYFLFVLIFINTILNVLNIRL